MNIINSMRLRNRKGSKLKEKIPPSSKIRVSLLQMQATERDLMDLSTIMIKAVRCFELGLECKNQDRSKYIHYLKVASAYMKNTVPLMKKMGLISGSEIGTGDVRSILSIRNILQGLRPDDSDAALRRICLFWHILSSIVPSWEPISRMTSEGGFPHI